FSAGPREAALFCRLLKDCSGLGTRVQGRGLQRLRLPFLIEVRIFGWAAPSSPPAEEVTPKRRSWSAGRSRTGDALCVRPLGPGGRSLKLTGRRRGRFGGACSRSLDGARRPLRLNPPLLIVDHGHKFPYFTHEPGAKFAQAAGAGTKSARDGPDDRGNHGR